MANTQTRLTGDDKKGLTERGLHSLLSWQLAWSSVAQQVVVVDTAEQGAMSIAFTIVGGSLNISGTIQASNDGVNWVECPSKDETGTEAAAGAGFSASAGSALNVILTYSDYPRYASFRFFRLPLLPDAIGTCLVHAVLK